MKKIIGSIGGATLAGLTVLLVGMQVHAEPTRATMPDIAKLVHYTTVTRGEVTEHIMTTREAIEAVKRGDPIPNGTHVALVDYRDGEVFRYFIMETLLAVDETVDALRRACPGSLIGVSTGAWIEGDKTRTRNYISAWKNLPDYASVNLSEPDAPAVIALLNRMGVAVEAGLASVSDTERFIALPDYQRTFRVLIEIEEQNIAKADAIVDEIARILERANVRRPILLHGFDAAVWHFVTRAGQSRWSTRVGLEDGCELKNGQKAAGNAELVAAAVEIFRMNAS